MKVMVVDDNEQNLYLLETLLRSEKYEVVCARDGLEALERLKEGFFGLIISDILMPRMDGFHLCRECKSDPHLKHIPFIFHTATYTDQKDEEFALSLGADRFIVKPIDPQVFLADIREVLQDYEKGARAANDPFIKDEESYLTQYNKRLIQKLEKKMLDLEMAHKALAESEKKYRSIFENAVEGIFQATPDGRYLSVNPALARMYGYESPEEVLKGTTRIPDEQFVHPDDLVRLKKHFEEEGHVEAFKVELYKRDGSRMWVSIHGRAARDEAGKILYYEGVVEDITERNRMEEALKKNEKRFQELFDEAPVGYHELNAEGHIIEVNQTESEMLGYSPNEMLGQPVWKFVLEEETSRQAVRAKLAGLLIPPKAFERTYKRKDGTPLPVLIKEDLLRDKDGKVMGIRSTVQDITERKRAEEALRNSEERYRSLVNHSTDLIFIVQDGAIKFSNPATMAISGYSEDELATTPFIEIIHPEDAVMVMERHQKRLQGQKVPNTDSFRILTKQRNEVWVQLNAVLITWEGRPGILCSLRDITTQKRLETQYFQAQKMEAIGTLAGGIAHDFNNILSAILGYAELASLELEEGTKAKHHLEYSMKAAHRAKDLVAQILAFSRQGRQERKPLNITPIVKEGLKFLRATLPATIEIHQDIKDDAGTIDADATQIHQVLMNLCTNAAHAMEERGGVLDVSVSNQDLDETSAASAGIGPGSYLRLRVRDTGYGMPPEMMKRIFDPYFTTKEAGKGTGLGLAVVHGIVRSCGGGIAVSSKVGKGSTFDILFPRIAAVALSPEDYKVDPLPVGFRERVIFVDDEESIVEVGREILEYLGYEVVARTSSKEALDLFRLEADRIDLVITDMTMPNMTGDKLAQELLKIRPGIPIILCTGFSEKITEERAKAIGVREFVMKPLVMRELAKAMRRILDFQRNRKN